MPAPRRPKVDYADGSAPSYSRGKRFPAWFLLAIPFIFIIVPLFRAARHKVAAAQLANREAALATARVRLSYTRIKASWEMGSDVRYVGERFVSEGAMLSPNTPILSIIELQPITAVIFVTDRDYFRLGTGQPATVTSSAFGGEPFAGRVARIAPLLLESSREARVEIEIQNEKRLLKPGMFINTRIEFARREAATGTGGAGMESTATSFHQVLEDGLQVVVGRGDLGHFAGLAGRGQLGEPRVERIGLRRLRD